MNDQSTPEKRRVLVVDDDEDTADLLVLKLASLGYDVRSTTEATEAVGMVSTFAPEVVLLDLGMPDQDGYQTAALILAHPRPPALIALSGFVGPSDVERSLAAGFSAHMGKPVDFSLLETTLIDLTRDR